MGIFFQLRALFEEDDDDIGRSDRCQDIIALWTVSLPTLGSYIVCMKDVCNQISLSNPWLVYCSAESQRNKKTRSLGFILSAACVVQSFDPIPVLIRISRSLKGNFNRRSRVVRRKFASHGLAQNLGTSQTNNETKMKRSHRLLIYIIADRPLQRRATLSLSTPEPTVDVVVGIKVLQLESLSCVSTSFLYNSAQLSVSQLVRDFNLCCEFSHTLSGTVATLLLLKSSGFQTCLIHALLSKLL